MQSGSRIERAVMGSLLEPLEPRLLLATGPILSEFMADNDDTLNDEDDVSSDWIELHTTAFAGGINSITAGGVSSTVLESEALMTKSLLSPRPLLKAWMAKTFSPSSR